MRSWFAFLAAVALTAAPSALAQSTVQLAPGRDQVTANAVPGLGVYSYDGSGNITAIGTQSFTYDPFGRLSTATVVPGRTQSFTYDRYGNLKEIKTTVGTAETKQPFGVDPATNQIDKPTGAANELTATYDPAGNVTHYDAGVFVYDSLNLLKTSSIGGIDRAYLYTASDERIAVVGINGGIERGADWTIRDLAGRVLRRFSKNPTDGAWRWSEDYIWRGSQLLAAEVPQQEKVRHFHLDHLGTPRIVTGNGGSQLATYEYDPFGLQIATPIASSGILDNPERLQFTGHERDTAKLDYIHARYYAPAAGRFLSVDVTWASADLGNPQSWNRYSYVENNPIIRIDPDGQQSAGFVAYSIAKADQAAYERGDITREELQRRSEARLKVAHVTVGGLLGGGLLGRLLGAGVRVTRYMTEGEANAARETGYIPNVGRDGKPRPTHVTTDKPVNDSTVAEQLYEIAKPTHRATVPKDRVPGLGPAPDGRSTTSGGGSQGATNQPIPVKPGEIVPMDRTLWDRILDWFK